MAYGGHIIFADGFDDGGIVAWDGIKQLGGTETYSIHVVQDVRRGCEDLTGDLDERCELSR